MIYFDIRPFSAQKHFRVQSWGFLLTAKDLYFRSKKSNYVQHSCNTRGCGREAFSICAEPTRAVHPFSRTSHLTPPKAHSTQASRGQPCRVPLREDRLL